jgi:hypothetical protein
MGRVLLEGGNEGGEAGTQMKEKQTAPEETEITAEEVDKQIRKLKKRKARGGMYGTERMVERMAELMNGVYRGQERRKTEPGITLLKTGYKLYTSVLSERMKREIEEKGVVPHSQAGFRKGRGTIDNMYILDHLEKSELKKKEGRMCADFRTAFDKVGTEKMFEYMRERERYTRGQRAR